MNPTMKEVFIVLLITSVVFGRTFRYKLLTGEDGRRELIDTSNDTISSPNLKFLEEDLNATTLNLPIAADRSDHEISTLSTNETHNIEPLKEDAYKLITKWNAFTERGWNRQKNALYLNSTKLMIYDDGRKNHSQVNEHSRKQQRSENLETEIEDNGDADFLEVLSSCYDEKTTNNSLVECLKNTVSDTILKYVEPSVEKTGKSGGEKTLLHGKKLLKGALLPLLVLLVIKYLIALPVIAVGLITIKTFWLSLLSAGVAAFGGPWKKQHSILQRQEQNYEPHWGYMMHGGQRKDISSIGVVTEKYYM